MNFDKPMVYAVRHSDENIRAASRSGGIFTALSDEILSNGGVIYGCVLSENFTAIHIRADRAEERNRMRGSKYIQSKLGETFRNVKADITIADYWGIEKAAPEFDDNKGVSLVLVNNEIGMKMFDSIKGDVEWKQTKLEDSMQTPLQKPFPKPDDREKFWKDFSENSFEYIARKYGGFSLIKRIKTRVKKTIKAVVNR